MECGIENKKAFGQRLKKLRESKGLSVVELSKIIGVSRISVGNWERGDTSPRIQHIKKYSDYFNVSEDWILYGDFEDWLRQVLKHNIQVGREMDLTYPTHMNAFTESIWQFIEYELDDNIFEDEYYVDIYRYDKEDFEDCTDEEFEAMAEYEKVSKEINFHSIISDVIDAFLFGWSGRIEKYLDNSILEGMPFEHISSIYIIFMKEIGYNEQLIIKETAKLFSQKLNPLKKYADILDLEEDFLLDIENAPENIKADLLSIIKPLHQEAYEKELKKALYTSEYSNYPNISKIQNRLEEIKEMEKDIPEPIAEAILKLLD